MKKKQSEVIGLNGVFNALTQMKTPFGILIAHNSRKLKSIVKKYDEEKELIQDKFLKKDNEGNFLGVLRKDANGNEKRVEKPTLFSDIECTDRKAFEKAIKDLDSKEIEVSDLRSIDCAKKIYWSKRDKEVTIREWMDSELAPIFILSLDEFGLLKNHLE